MDYLKGNPFINRGFSGACAQRKRERERHTHTYMYVWGKKIKKKECGRVRIFNGDVIKFFRI